MKKKNRMKGISIGHILEFQETVYIKDKKIPLTLGKRKNYHRIFHFVHMDREFCYHVETWARSISPPPAHYLPIVLRSKS